MEAHKANKKEGREEKKSFIFLRSMSWIINIPEIGMKGFIVPQHSHFYLVSGQTNMFGSI